MKTYYEHAGITIYHGDCREVLPTLAERSVQTCVTSPPYWGLRDYGTAMWEGGDDACDHRQETPKPRDFTNSRGESSANGYAGTSCTSWSSRDMTVRPGNTCRKCGARRVDSQLGLEPTPEEYVAAMVKVFREVRRVLKDDGTLWLNLGDSYCGYKGDKYGVTPGNLAAHTPAADRGSVVVGTPQISGLKPKNLVGIPWRVAFALQADGWYLRQDIIWSKPNPMPESVTDRCTKAHEYVFLLAKSQKYYYDAEAIKEPATYAKQMRGGSTNRYEQNAAGMDRKVYDHRNKRDVWTVPTEPFKQAHFATFPLKLIEPCILAGCPHCGVVLDPFGGSGTVAEVSKRHQRQCISIDLNAEYLPMQANRLAQEVLPFAAVGGPIAGEKE